MKDERAHLQLFDLIAREWQLPAPANQVLFNATDTGVAFACADGSILLAGTADKASPNVRTRRAVDTGRVTIAPRDKPVSPLKTADYTEGRSSALARHGATNFIFAKDTGRMNTLTPGGIAVHLPQRTDGPISAVAASADGQNVAFACGNSAYIGDKVFAHPGPISAMAFSPDGETLAVAHGSDLTRWTLGTNPVATHMPLPAPATELLWAEDGQTLAILQQSDGFSLLHAGADAALHHGNFPSPVRSVGFNPATQTVIASGAFRVAGWTLADNQNVMTGKSGLILIDSIATCPTRNLVAVGYANGLLSLAEIGRPSEILLREDTGATICAMAWSGDGKFLALAGADGSAALVEFPDTMFKPN